jgi:hypothetical protein
MILDTWPRFAATALRCLDSAETFLDAWHDRYLSRWPSLRRKCLDDYAQQGEDWRALATKWIYPVVRTQARRMAQTRAKLLAVIPEVDARYRRLVKRAPRVRYVVMVDIGFAGWATDYRGSRAILLGLAQIARLGWHSRQSLRDLIAHELAHQVHGIWRRRARVKDSPQGAVDDLYSEGFAARMEHELAGASWHRHSQTWPGWLDECRRREPALAAQYLRAMRRGSDLRAFFGDWLALDGLSATGVYLGHEFIRWLEASGMSLREIAALPSAEVRRQAERFLKSRADVGSRLLSPLQHREIDPKRHSQSDRRF